MAEKDNSSWGYSKDDARIFSDGKLPDGYFPNPAMVPGSEAEKRYREDAERDGASIPWDVPADPNVKPDASAPSDQKPTLTMPKAKG